MIPYAWSWFWSWLFSLCRFSPMSLAEWDGYYFQGKHTPEHFSWVLFLTSIWLLRTSGQTVASGQRPPLILILLPNQPTNQQMVTFARFLTHCQCPHSYHSCLWWGLENVHILQIDRDFHISYTLLLSQRGNGAWNVSLFLGFVWHRLNNAQRHFWIISCGSRNLVRNRPLLVQMLRSSQLTIHCE